MYKMIKGLKWISIFYKIFVNNKKNFEVILIL